MMEAYEITDQKRMKALTFERHKEMLFEQTCKAITDYFPPRICVEYEIHRFKICRQKEDDTRLIS